MRNVQPGAVLVLIVSLPLAAQALTVVDLKHIQVFPPTFDSYEHPPETASTSTVWTVRATFGPQTATAELDVRAPGGPLDALYQMEDSSSVPYSSSQIVSSAQGEWNGFGLEESAVRRPRFVSSWQLTPSPMQLL